MHVSILNNQLVVVVHKPEFQRSDINNKCREQNEQKQEALRRQPSGDADGESVGIGGSAFFSHLWGPAAHD
jgi:hypothetical protein